MYVYIYIYAYIYIYIYIYIVNIYIVNSKVLYLHTVEGYLMQPRYW